MSFPFSLTDTVNITSAEATSIQYDPETGTFRTLLNLLDADGNTVYQKNILTDALPNAKKTELNQWLKSQIE